MRNSFIFRSVCLLSFLLISPALTDMGSRGIPQIYLSNIPDGLITEQKLDTTLQNKINAASSSNVWTVSPVTQITTANTTLTITHGIQQYEGIGGITLTSTPTIAAGVDGQLVRIRCVSDTNILTLQSASNLPGSDLILSNGRNFNCGNGDSLLAAYNGLTTRWEEVSRIDIN